MDNHTSLHSACSDISGLFPDLVKEGVRPFPGVGVRGGGLKCESSTGQLVAGNFLIHSNDTAANQCC